MIAKTVFYPFVCKFSELQKGSKAWGSPVSSDVFIILQFRSWELNLATDLYVC